MSSNDLNLDTEVKVTKSNKYCFGFFGRDNLCKDGDKCRYSHDVNNYLETKNLIFCPNQCGRYCKNTSRMCSTCVTKWLEEKKENDEYKEKKHNEWLQRNAERERRKMEFDAREEKQCAGYNCSNFSKFKFCKECYDVNARYSC